MEDTKWMDYSEWKAWNEYRGHTERLDHWRMDRDVPSLISTEINKKEDMEKNANLQDWIFHYNIYTGNWEAAKREHYVYLFSGTKPQAIIKSPKIDVLVELINKYDDAFKINKLF